MKKEVIEKVPKAIKIEVHTNTIEDYRHKLLPPIQSDLHGNDLFKVIELGDKKAHHQELITLNDEGRLVHYHPDQTTHGWHHNLLPLDKTSFEKLVVTTEDENIHGFFMEKLDPRAANVITMKCNSKKEWERTKVTGELEELLKNVITIERFTDHQKQDYIYGLSYLHRSQFVAFILVWKEGNWVISYQRAVEPGDKVFLVDGYNAYDFTLLRITNRRKHFFSHGNINDGRIIFTRERALPKTEEDTVNTNQNITNNERIKIYPIITKRNNGIAPDSFSTIYENGGILVQLNINGQELSITSTILAMAPSEWSPGPVSSVNCGTDKDGFPVIIAHNQRKDKTFMLSTRELLGGLPVLKKQWFLLGTHLKNFAIPHHLNNGFEAFLVQQDGSLVHTVKDVKDQTFHDHLIASPHESEDTVKAPSHCLEIKATTKNDLGAAFRPFTLKASRPCTCWVNDQMVRLGPSKEVSLVTAASGMTNIKFPANSISVPAVEIYFPDFMEQGEFRSFSADKSLHERMAGKDPLYKVDIKTMHSHGLVPDPEKLGEKHADEIEKAVNRFANALLKTHGDELDLLEQHDPVGWEFDFKPAGGHPMVIRRMNDSEMETAFSASTLSAGQDISGLGEWLGEALRHIGHTIEQVGKVVVRFVNNVMEMVVHLIDNVTKLILKGAEIVAAAFEALFKRIAKAFNILVDVAKSFINWLKQVFGWNDVLNTYHVMKHGMEQQLTGMVNMFGKDNQTYVKKQFDHVHSQLESLFDQAQEAFKPGGKLEDKTSMRHLYDKGHGSGNNKPDPVLNSPFMNQYKASQYQIGFVAKHAFANAPDIKSMMMSSLTSDAEGVEFIESFKVFIKQISEALERHNMRDKADEINNYFHQNFSSPTDFLESSMTLLLEITRELALLTVEIFEEVVILMMDLIGQAIKLLKDVLTAPLEIPLISDLFRFMVEDSQAKLTLIDLAALANASAGTLIYKLINNGKAPVSKGDREDFVKIALPLGDLKTIIEGATVIDSADIDTLKRLEPMMQYLAAVTLLPYTFFDVALDIDSAARMAVPAPEHPAVNVCSLMIWGSSLSFQALSTPYGFIYNTNRKAGDWSGVVSWTAGLIPLTIDGIVWVSGLFPTRESATRNTRVTIASPPIGPLITCATGVLFGLAGVANWTVASIIDEKVYGWEIAEELFLNLPVASEISLYAAVDPELKPFVMGGLSIIDLIGGVGGCLTHVQSTSAGGE